ncbi:MAG: glycosyltransferase family A protein [Bacteroidota bacterium]
MPDPFISIIIPSFNRAAFLAKNIPYLLDLDYINYEIIVVDDGSTDNTTEIFDKIQSPKLSYYKKQNEERAAARNYGAAYAKGDYITFLDSDDELYNDALKNAAKALEEKKYPDFMHMAYDIGTIDHVSKTIKDIKDNDPLILVVGNPLSCMGIFIKKEVFNKHKFNTDRRLSASEDWELWVRIAANHGLRTDNRIIGRLIEHDSRSVISFPEDKLVDRKDLAVKYAFADPAVQKVYGPFKSLIEAHWDTYVALHLAIDGKKKRATYYFMDAIKKDYRCLFTKRSLVICKLILLK